MRKIFVTMLLVSICQLLSAQTYSLSGVVRNQDGEPVAGAKVGIVDLNTFYKYEQDMFDILEVRGDTVYICTTDDEGRYDATNSKLIETPKLLFVPIKIQVFLHR
jgi:hypothetical protein